MTLGVPRKQPVPSFHHGPFFCVSLNLINAPEMYYCKGIDKKGVLLYEYSQSDS